MRAVVYDEYGGPEVLHLAEVEEPHTGPGEVRVRVAAVSVNPYDVKVRSGAMADGPLTEQQIPGFDAAGRVDELGEGVDNVAVGDLVFGSGSRVTAEYAVLHAYAPVPPGLDATEAAGLPTVVEAAGRVLRLLDLSPGDVVVVDGAAGGVGSAVTQLAVARGLVVVGTAPEQLQDYLRDLGATPTTFGPGLADRVLGLVDEPVAGGLDLVGKGSVPDLIELTGDPHQVVTIADFDAGRLGARVTDGSEGRAYDSFDEVVALVRAGRFHVEVAEVLGWERMAAAHALVASGTAHGKVIVTVG